MVHQAGIRCDVTRILLFVSRTRCISNGSEYTHRSILVRAWIAPRHTERHPPLHVERMGKAVDDVTGKEMKANNHCV